MLDLFIELSYPSSAYLLQCAEVVMLLLCLVFALLAYQAAARIEKYQREMKLLAEAIVENVSKDKQTKENSS